jgi:hypothetical protein
MFIGTHWSEARKPVLRGLMALALVLLGLTVLRVTAAS